MQDVAARRRGVGSRSRRARVATAHGPLYTLRGGHGTRIALEPSSSAARYAGRSVRVSGIFTVSFSLGYEILISKITPSGTL